MVGDNFTLLLFDEQNYETRRSSSVNSCTHRNWSENARGFPGVKPPTLKSAIWAYCRKTLPVILWLYNNFSNTGKTLLLILWLCNNFSNTGKSQKFSQVSLIKMHPPNSLRSLFSLKRFKPFTFFASPFYSPPENSVTMTQVYHSTLLPGHGCSGVVIMAE